MQAIASPNATSTEIQTQPGTFTCPSGSTSTCDHPKAPPTTIRPQRKKVLMKVPFADIVAKPALGACGGAPAPEVSVAVAVRAGAAQPGSSSSAVAANRLSLSTGLAI